MSRLSLRSTLAAIFVVSLILTMSWSLVESGAPSVPSGQTGALFYYADGQRIPLTPSPGEIALRFKAGASQDQKRQVFGSLGVSTEAGRRDNILEIPNPRLTIMQVGLVGAAQIQSLAAELSPQPQVEFAHPLFVFDNDDTKLALTDEFLVQFKAGVSRAEIQALNARHGVEIVEETFWADNNFTLRVTPASDLDVLAMANLYHESPLTEYAGPNFVRLMKPLAWPNDTYIGDQWSLRNTGQHGGTVDADIDADEAWDITTGSADMTIAVIDEGVETGHEDLRGNMAQGYDATDGDDDPTPRPWDAHGTNCAGIAAAMGDNGRGVAGVAWGSRIMPIRIAYSTKDGGDWVAYESWVANAINWAWQHGADVLSNSWGGGSPSSQITTAISNAKTQGRDGKGSVVVFAAGNRNDSILYPATLSTVMAVGATNLCDQRKTPDYDTCNYFEYWWGSNYGSQLDISAPGVALHSTDNSLAAGRSLSSYFGGMNGTSGATPHVAGAAALVLSVNPTLTASQVESILTSNADDKGSAGWDQYYGWGRLNAHRAVSSTTHYLQLSSNSLIFMFEDSGPATLDLDIVNPATSAGTWNAVCTGGDCSDISVGSPSGNTPSRATVTADKPDFYGTYSATIQVSSTRPSHANSPQTVNVTISRVSSISEVYLPLILHGSSGPSLDIGFSDDMESGTSKWTAKWPWWLTTTTYNSYYHSWADSPSGYYSNNRRSLTLTSIPFSLAGIGSPQMTFYHYYSIHSSIEYKDYGLVEVSSDGLNWETVGVYTGYHSYWAQETINLSAYANSPYLRVRFRFESDEAVTDDGWYVDDVTVSD
ncbi:MAG: S8 family serine peptidase [Anaerolineae bacterium]